VGPVITARILQGKKKLVCQFDLAEFHSRCQLVLIVDMDVNLIVTPHDKVTQTDTTVVKKTESFPVRVVHDPFLSFYESTCTDSHVQLG